jgi:hypothetical protein
MTTRLGITPEFLTQVGRFYGLWAAIELAIDYSKGQFLKLPAEETHLLTAGNEFNRKSRVLMALIKRNDHPKKDQLLSALKIIQNESLRNLFAHSFLDHDENEVTFVQRWRGGQYDPRFVGNLNGHRRARHLGSRVS